MHTHANSLHMLATVLHWLLQIFFFFFSAEGTVALYMIQAKNDIMSVCITQALNVDFV